MNLFKKFAKALIFRLPHRPRKRLLRLVSIKDYPAYLGRTVVPDTFFWAKLCFDVAKILFRRDYRRRRGLVARVSQSTDDRIPPDKGYLLKDLSSNQVVVRAIEFCRDPALRRRLMERAQTAKKPFLITLPIDLRQESSKPILELACDNALLGPISEYIGMIPVLQYAKLMYSPNVEYYGRSQMFHLDGGDYRLVKCYVFVDEVDLGSGPLTIIPAVESRKIYDRLRQKGMTRRRNEKFDDDTIYSVSDLKAGIPLVGKSGIVAFVDTCNCYHFGSRPGSKPRWLLYLVYYSPWSTEMPLWGRRYDPAVLAMNKGHKDKELRDLVLGLSHLNFVELRMRKQSRASGGDLEMSGIVR